MNETSPLQIAKTTRNALRRIRQAAVDESISPEEMQSESSMLLNNFAKALLETTNPSKLHQKDQNPEVSHLKHLGNYVKDLLPDVTGLNLVGNPIDDLFINLMLNLFPRESHLQKFHHINDDEFPVIIAILSTGALALAISAYINNFTIYVAAVDKERKKTILPNFDPEGKDISVIDDVVGRQAQITADEAKRRHPESNIKTINLSGK